MGANKQAGWGLDPAVMWETWSRAWGLRAPLSGDVTQAIETSLVRSLSEQLGFINVNASLAGDPDLERRITHEVPSYGRQLGRVLDALDVLIRHDDLPGLPAGDRRALDELHDLHAQVQAAKQRSAQQRAGRLVAGVRALRRDPEANDAALRRLRAAPEDD